MARDGQPGGRAGRALRGAGVVAGAAAGLAGAAYAIERAVVAGVRRRPDPDAGKALVPPFDEAVRYPSQDGGSVYTIRRGKGPPIVFSHGVTLSTRVWVKQFELLPDQGFRCIGFDHRGHGDSECGDSGHSIANLAEDVRTVLERMDLRDAILVGHSMGGISLQAFASQYSEVAAERVRGMVLVSSLAKTYLSGFPAINYDTQKIYNKDLAATDAKLVELMDRQKRAPVPDSGRVQNDSLRFAGHLHFLAEKPANRSRSPSG